MAIIENKKQHVKSTGSHALFGKVCKHCLPHMLIISLVPFAVIILSLLLRIIGAKDPSEFLVSFIAFPLALISPVFFTVKQINTLKDAFPRNKDETHKVILSVLFCTSVCIILVEILFNISCSLFSLYPLEFRGAAYMRDMYASSPAAMNITYVTCFFVYSMISMMATTAYFIGVRSRKKYSFTISCLIFAGMYTVLLVLFMIAYIGATFLDIIALERIQISGSVFNSSMLCFFVTFIVITILTYPILYLINAHQLKNLPRQK